VKASTATANTIDLIIVTRWTSPTILGDGTAEIERQFHFDIQRHIILITEKLTEKHAKTIQAGPFGSLERVKVKAPGGISAASATAMIFP
jgi:hypothetical protein